MSGPLAATLWFVSWALAGACGAVWLSFRAGVVAWLCFQAGASWIDLKDVVPAAGAGALAGIGLGAAPLLLWRRVTGLFRRR
jgi:hypothetical protein